MSNLPIIFKYLKQKEILFLFWLAPNVIAYIYTTLTSVQMPLNKGMDTEWAIIWSVIILLVVLSHWQFRSKLTTQIWLGMLTFIASTMVILSHNLGPFLITIGLLILAGVWGDWLLTRLGIIKTGRNLELIILAVLLGLIIFALITLAVLAIGYFQPPIIWGLILILTLLQWKRIARTGQNIPPQFLIGWTKIGDLAIFERLLILLIAFSFLLSLTWSLAPETQFDPLNYHLTVPKFYIQAGYLIHLSYFWHSYLAHLMEMLYALLLITGGQISAKLLSFGFSLACLSLVHVVGVRYFSRQIALLAATIFATTPFIIWYSSTTYIDIAVAAFFLAALLALFHWLENRNNGWLWISGILGGAAFGAKLIAAFALIPMGLILLWIILKEYLLPVRRWLKSGSLITRFISGFCLIGLPWYAIVYIFTGNPFFPMLNGIFKSPYESVENTWMNLATYGMGKSAAAIISLPITMTYQTEYFAEAFLPGALGLALIITLPFCFGVRTSSRFIYWSLVFISMVYSIFWAFSAQNARFYMVIYPIISLLAAITFYYFLSKNQIPQRIGGVLISLCLVVQLPLSISLFWQIPERLPYKVAFGLETPEEFLSRTLPAYGAIKYINEHADLQKDRVYGLNVDYLRFYLDVPLYSLVETRAMRYIFSLPPGKKLFQAFQSQNVRFILAALPDTTGFVDSKQPFINQYTKPVYANKGSYVFELVSTPQQKAAIKPTNLLEDAGFEGVNTKQAAIWLPFGTPLIASNGHPHQGQVAVQVDKENGLTQFVPVEANRIYELSHFSRADQPDQYARLQINWLDAENQFIDAAIEVVPANSEWTEHRMLATAPQRAVLAQIYVSVHEDSQVWFDDFSFISKF